MAKLELLKVEVTPSKVCKPADNLQFELTFNNQAYLPDDIEFEVVYIGDTYNETRDQKICENVIGPLEAGKLCFKLETTAIDVTKIPITTLFGLTTILIVGKYHDQQFVRIGYVVDVKHQGVDSEKLVAADQSTEEDGEDIEDEEDSEEDLEIIDDEELEDEEGCNQGQCCDNEEGCCNEGECDQEGCEEGCCCSADCDQEGCEEGCCCEESSEEGSDECCNEEELNLGDALEKALTGALMPKKRADIPFETPIVAGKDDFEYNGIQLKQSKIEMHFLEKPIIQVFEIDWCNEASEKSIDDSSENNSNHNEEPSKKQRIE